MRYPYMTATEVLAKREAFKKHVIIEWANEEYRDRLVEQMFDNHIFPIVGEVNLFQTVAAFQPGR